MIIETLDFSVLSQQPWIPHGSSAMMCYTYLFEMLQTVYHWFIAFQDFKISSSALSIHILCVLSLIELTEASVYFGTTLSRSLHGISLTVFFIQS